MPPADPPTTYAPKCWPGTDYPTAVGQFPQAVAYPGTALPFTAGAGAVYTSGPLGDTANRNQNVAMCPVDTVLTGFCAAGGSSDDCSALFLHDGWSNIKCSPVPAGTTRNGIVDSAGVVTCYTRNATTGGLNVGCPPDSVLVGLGASGNDATSTYGVDSPNTGYNNAMCGALSDGYVLDRSAPQYVTPQVQVWGTYGTLVGCPANTVGTEFCKSDGGNANCVNPATNAAVTAWMRCDQIKPSTAPAFPPADTSVHCTATPSSTDAGTACTANAGVTVKLTCPGGGCVASSPIQYGTEGKNLTLNGNYSVTVSDPGKAGFLTLTGDVAPAGIAQIPCGTCPA